MTVNKVMPFNMYIRYLSTPIGNARINLFSLFNSTRSVSTVQVSKFIVHITKDINWNYKSSFSSSTSSAKILDSCNETTWDFKKCLQPSLITNFNPALSSSVSLKPNSDSM
jgi:hypothetical protein